MSISLSDNDDVNELIMATQMINSCEPAAAQCPLEDARWRIICEWPGDPRLTAV